ncbi:MAG: hypothetical protein K6T99_10290 [Armatimonadetes bacterium]|nr:hypothetical protein [Armatimonadota bacterium]
MSAKSSIYKRLLPSKPVYSLVGGMWYDTSLLPNTSSTYSAKGYSGENYAYFRIYNAVENSRTYRSTIYANLPMAIFQYEKGAIGLVFEPLSEGRPLSLCVSSTEDDVTFEYRNDVKHLLRSKSRGFVGPWEREEDFISNAQVPPVQEISADSWMELVRRYISRHLRNEPRLKDLSDAIHMAIGFYDRAFDAGNCVHADTLLTFAPSDFGDPIYSYPSFEACRLASLARADEWRLERWEKIADKLLSDEASVRLVELGDVRVWHNALVPNGDMSKLKYTTGYGTGYCGWPGGMAYTLRGLIEYCMKVGRSNACERIRSGLNWFLAIQLPDGGFPFNVPTFIDFNSMRGRCLTGPKSRAVGGAGEAIRTLCAGYKFLDDEHYLEAAKRAVEAVNPRPPYYGFRGYGDLRDAGDYESDSTSGCSLGNANLDLFEVTGDRNYLETATALGYYLLTWHFWWTPGPNEILGLIDPMAESFSPHASPWNTALAAEFYLRLYRYTGDEFWFKVAQYVLAQCLRFQNRSTGGISETYPIRLDGTYTDMGGESAMVTWALINGCLAMLEASGVSLEARKDNAHLSCDSQVSFYAEVSVYSNAKKSNRVQKLKNVLAHAIRKRIWKKLPISVAKRLKKLVEKPSVHNIPVPHEGPVRRLLLSPGNSLEGFAFSVDQVAEEYVVSLKSFTYTANVKRVFMPILRFPSPVVNLIESEKIGETITSVKVKTQSGRYYEVRFLPGSYGLGASAVELQDGRLAFDVTLKALWQRGGICTQRILVVPIEAEENS